MTGPIGRRGKYKKYWFNKETKIPRTSLWRIRRRNRLGADNEGSDSTSTLSPRTSSHPAGCGESTSILSCDIPPSAPLHDIPEQVIHSKDIDTEDHGVPYSEQIDVEHTEDVAEQLNPHDNLHDPDRHPYTDPCTDPKDFEKIYDGSAISICTFNCCVMKFAIKHSLTYKAIDDLLDLVNFLCPKPNQMPSSIYKLQQFFKQHESPQTSKKLYCTKCDKLFDDCDCGQPDSVGHLVNISIDKPLQAVLSEQWSSLIFPTEDEPSVITDVWDAAHLKSDSFFFSGKNIALSLFSDGIPIFKSSKVSLWPVYCSILNLPSAIRSKSKNIILSGLWVGPTKPPMQYLLRPTTQQIDHLSTAGLRINLATEIITIKAKLVLGIFDLPAKAIVLSAKQYNGEFGCSVCLHPGILLSKRRVYPPVPPRSCRLRTHQSVVSSAAQASKHGRTIQGIKGISPLTSYLNLVDGVPVDYMHAVLEGVLGRLMKLWFNSNNHRKPYYLGKSIKNIDDLLMSQTPPEEFSRSPRSITHRHYWKATELKQWLLYYSLPILKSKLPPLYWHHYALLVCAMHILLRDQIAYSELNATEMMLQDFHDLFEDLYQEVNCTHNVHLLTHLTKYVKLWGPLWTHSAFSFENKNGLLKHFFHGTNNITHQILFNISTESCIQSLVHFIKLNDGDEIFQYVYQDNHIKSNMTCIYGHVYACGNIELATLTQAQQVALDHKDNCQVFYRLLKEETMYHCTNYYRNNSGKRNNSYCIFLDANGSSKYGQIVLFIYYPKPCALINEIDVEEHVSLTQQAGHTSHCKLIIYQDANILSSFIPSVKPSERLKCVDIKNIIKKAILINVGLQLYISSIVNPYEYH